MKRSRIVLFAVLIAAALGGPAGLAADENPASAEQAGARVRLVLVDGSHYDARGPVSHKDDLILFYGEDGRLSSIRTSEVREVLHLDETPDARPAAVPAKRPSVTPAPAGETTFTNVSLPDPNVAPPEEVFTNEDLPEAPESTSATAGDEETGDGESESGESVAPGDAGVDESGAPAVDDAAWRVRLTEVDAGIVEAEGEVTAIRRLLDCAQRGVPLDSGECRPRTNRQMKNEKIFKSPTETSLREHLVETQKRLEQLRTDRRRVLDEARTAGVDLE